jgi:hypothetical protein
MSLLVEVESEAGWQQVCRAARKFLCDPFGLDFRSRWWGEELDGWRGEFFAVEISSAWLTEQQGHVGDFTETGVVVRIQG